MKTSIVASVPPSSLTVCPVEKEIAERVGEEILEKRFSPRSWAEALVAARVNGGEVPGEYARIRLAELTEDHNRRSLKAESLEIRRLRNGGGVKSVKDLLRTGPVFQNHLKVKRPGVSILWLLSLIFGSAGTTGCWMRLFHSGAGTGSTLLVACLGGMVIGGLAILLWATLPKHWLQLGYNLGLGGATTVFCLLSFYLGILVLNNAPQHWQLRNHRIVPVAHQTRTAKAPRSQLKETDPAPVGTTASTGLSGEF